nr:putative e3 ubiquitin-protein ligase ari5 [Quercus suber]
MDYGPAVEKSESLCSPQDKLDPALLRPGRMDLHVHMSYCTMDGFKLLASNYLDINGDHELYRKIEGLLENVEKAKAVELKELLKSDDDTDVDVEGFVKFLMKKKLKNAKAEGAEQLLKSDHTDVDAAIESEDYLYDSDAEETTDDDHYYYSSKQSYVLLKESDIQQRQENEITEVSNVLFISKAAATVLLLHYNRRVSDVQDGWFADEERIRKKVGLFEKPVFLLPGKLRKVELTCYICYENVRVSMMGWVSCNHPFCRDCWEKDVSVAIEDGVGCLTLRCPKPRCNAVVDHDSIDLFAKKEDMERYSQYLIRSYIESNKKYKWCPGADCEYAIELCEGGGDECYDVCCHCNIGFRWNCMDDAHRPVDCQTLAMWQLKNSSEAQNTAWMLINTKRCPKCGKPIEKNQ